MGNKVIEAVLGVLRGAQIKDVPRMESEQDLRNWLTGMKRFRDINETELEGLDRDYEVIATTEEDALKRFKITEPNSLMRRKCLETIDECRRKATGLDKKRTIRRTNVRINDTLIDEVEAVIAAGDLGLDIEQIDKISARLKEGIEGWVLDSGIAGKISPAQSIESDTERLRQLERELEGPARAVEQGLEPAPAARQVAR